MAPHRADGEQGNETRPVLFGDALALARQSWVRAMAERVGALGHPDFRRADTAILRALRRDGPCPVGVLGARLRVTRQAARKLVRGLEQRGYVATGRDPEDSRVVRVALTPAGEAYAQALVQTVRALNADFAGRVGAHDLAVAVSVLRAATTVGDPV